MESVLRTAGKWVQPCPASLSGAIELASKLRTEAEDEADMEGVVAAGRGTSQPTNG